MLWNINFIDFCQIICIFCRTVFSSKTFLILPFMFTGRVHWEFTAAIAAANVGTSLSMALSALLLCPLTELSTWLQAVIKISIASAILRGTVITSIKERCVWDSGSATALHMETLMAQQDGIHLLNGFFLFGEPETSAGRAIWRSFDRRQERKFSLAHENIIAHKKGFPRNWKQIRHAEKVYLVKTKSAVSFSSD